ncbi:MAG: hypothetical protein ACMUIS_04490 [bacterium]
MGDFIRYFSRVAGLWLVVVLWWGLIVLAPLQIHNGIVIRDLPAIAGGIYILLLMGFWKKWRISFRSMRQEWLLPLLLIAALDAIAILYFRSITFSFILTSLCILLTGHVLNLASFIDAGSLLFLTSAGFGITHLIMHLVRGIPTLGSRFFARQIAFLLTLFGKDAHVVMGTLFFQGKKITCDLMKMGFFPWLALSLAFLAFIATARGSRKKKAYAAGIGIVLHYLYLVGRAALLFVFVPDRMYAGAGTFNLFYWRILVFSCIPLLLIWLFILYEADLSEPEKGLSGLFSAKPSRMDPLLFAATVITVLFMTLSFLFHGFARHRDIHVIIDEVHSDWESSLIDFNQDIFGTLAENSYHSLLDYLRHFYPATILSNKPGMAPNLEGVELIHTPILTGEVLDGATRIHPERHPVLVLKCITTAFSPYEIDIIRDFVSRGGSVLLIGDHTDVFFMNKNLNELAGHFGIRFEQNSVYFIDGGWVITDPPHYESHPATHFLGRFIWATGDSVTLKSPAFPLITSSPVCFADEVNYFYENFFGNTTIDADEVFGSYCVMAGSRYGKGRIIAFTDSTCFNNYLMFSVGRRPLIAGIFGWLGDTDSTNPFPLLTYLSFCVLGVIMLKRWRGFDSFLRTCILGVILGWGAGYLLAMSMNALLYPPPAPIRPLPQQVIMDASHDPLHAMSYGNSESFLAPTSYDSLLFNIGRIDLFTRIHYEGSLGKRALDGSSCLIIASPREQFCARERDAIRSYVQNGGSLLLIEGAHHDSTVNQIAHLFDMHVRLDPYRNTIDAMNQRLARNGRDALRTNPAWVDGGTMLFGYEGMPIVIFKREGKGMILAFGDDGLFMKENFQAFGRELVTMQCFMVEALVGKDEELLRSIRWNYVGDGDP